MGEIVKQKKKKGRPSKADLARRAAEAEAETDRRRTLRRRSVSYNVDEDYEEEAREGHAPSGSESDDGGEEKPLKKRRVDGCSDEEDYEDRGRKVDFKGGDSLPGTPCEFSSGVPLPEKKKLELILDKLQKKDIYGVYAEPVDPDELPDYHDVIEHPMDFSTVRKKLGNGSYSTLEQLESDIFLICSNAMQYNSADTIYHKQARSIEELTRRKFRKLRIEFERFVKETKSEQTLAPNSSARKQIRKPLCRNTQEPVAGSDFSSGANLATATADLPNSSILTQSGACERPGNADRLVENNSPLDHTYTEKTEELSSGKGLFSKLGKKSFLSDENPRATYNISCEAEVGSESVLATFDGEVKQLVAVGLHAEYSYARSLARFAATIGPVAWRVASQRIEQVLPDGCKYGRGWVGEYEPLPTPVLVVENRIQNQSALPRRLQGGSGGPRKPDETFKTSLSPREQHKPSLFAGTPNISTRHQQNQNVAPKNFQDSRNKVSKQMELNSPSSVNRNIGELVPGRQLPNGSEMRTETVTRNMNPSHPAPFKQPNSNGAVSRGLPNGSKVRNTSSSPRVASPSPDLDRTAMYFPRGQGHEPGLTDPVQAMRVQHKREVAPPPPAPATKPPAPIVKREELTSADSPNAASVAARAWMSLGAAGGLKHQTENPSTRKDQISADSLYNPTREQQHHPHFAQARAPRAEFPPSRMHFRPETPDFRVPVQMGNRPMTIPQMVSSADLSRFQVPSHWRGLSPRSQASQRHDTFPPDLNIGFQSPGSPARQASGVMIDSQQPDLALQL